MQLQHNSRAADNNNNNNSNNYGLAWALLPLSLGMILFAYWLLVVKVYLARIRDANLASHQHLDDNHHQHQTNGVNSAERRKLIAANGTGNVLAGANSKVSSCQVLTRCCFVILERLAHPSYTVTVTVRLCCSAIAINAELLVVRGLQYVAPEIN